jgi:hypothetical protein
MCLFITIGYLWVIWATSSAVIVNGTFGCTSVGLLLTIFLEKVIPNLIEIKIP